MRVATNICPGPTSTELERLDKEIESHPIWTELRGPVTGNNPANNTDPTGKDLLGDVLGGFEMFSGAGDVLAGIGFAAMGFATGGIGWAVIGVGIGAGFAIGGGAEFYAGYSDVTE